MRKVYVDVETRLIINMDEGIEVADVLQEMQYDFISSTIGASIEESEITDWHIRDSE